MYTFGHLLSVHCPYKVCEQLDVGTCPNSLLCFQLCLACGTRQVHAVTPVCDCVTS